MCERPGVERKFQLQENRDENVRGPEWGGKLNPVKTVGWMGGKQDPACTGLYIKVRS